MVWWLMVGLPAMQRDGPDAAFFMFFLGGQERTKEAHHRWIIAQWLFIFYLSSRIFDFNTSAGPRRDLAFVVLLTQQWSYHLSAECLGC
jgi:hypothetical protein